MLGKIIGMTISLSVLAILITTAIDFYQITQNKDPMFCITKTTKEYDDGTVDICQGTVYKVYEYHRQYIAGVEFVPFWGQEKENIDN
ncbi:MAG: hypothetical protein Q4G04_04280 [bacterium]|nr:hypothetical protein [bacterium]